MTFNNPQSQRHAQNQGFTLIEVVLVLAIFALLSFGLMRLYVWHDRIFAVEQADIRATGSARTAMNSFNKYIPQASQILASRTISGTTYTTGTSTVVLQLPSYNNSGVIANTSDYIVFYKSGANLYQLTTIGSGSLRHAGTKKLSAYVTSLTFTYNTGDPTLANQITIDLQTQATTRGNIIKSAHLADVIRLRNR